MSMELQAIVLGLVFGVIILVGVIALLKCSSAHQKEG